MGLFTGRSRVLRFGVLDVQASNRIMNVRNYPRQSCGRCFVTFRCVDDVHQTFRIVIHIQGVPGGMCQTAGECSLC